MRLKDKVAMVTGGASGIGQGISLRMAEEGADIVAIDLNEQGLEETATQIRALGRKALTWKVDVTIREEVERAVEEAIRACGQIDILVNNAGVEWSAVLVKMSDECWDKVLNINLKAVFTCTQAVARRMAERRYGKIINISSVAGKTAIFGGANYCAAKAGVIGLTRVSALELAKKGINVNAICPGPIDTPMFRGLPEKNRQQMIDTLPKGRVGKPRDIANLALFLASDEADYITGQAINCDGGWMMY